MQRAYRSFLYCFSCCQRVPLCMWCTKDIDLGAAQNRIVDHNAAHRQGEYQCKINPWVALGLKSIYVLSNRYAF
jgi:hypothetical protein